MHFLPYRNPITSNGGRTCTKEVLVVTIIWNHRSVITAVVSTKTCRSRNGCRSSASTTKPAKGRR